MRDSCQTTNGWQVRNSNEEGLYVFYKNASHAKLWTCMSISYSHVVRKIIIIHGKILRRSFDHSKKPFVQSYKRLKCYDALDVLLAISIISIVSKHLPQSSDPRPVHRGASFQDGQPVRLTQAKSNNLLLAPWDHVPIHLVF